MTHEERKNHCYLGDGVYVEWVKETQDFILRTGDHQDGLCDNKIYLEPGVYHSLILFCASKLNEE